ncbi:hypothetical protein KDW_14080 [Dictyobacter vulcani]|uniref:Uncharacterized protein n=1 Tax=Dictyobacter vulcani TaxID=2607529 RepID=A0A5J4KPW4_9CHLR|nr:DUF4097 family beta strand repeat-containing protein [Dictyobacter vulcani]GER87246.1 hypothetical protein KDW_14080 [Dictyobacter vulcani]
MDNQKASFEDSPESRPPFRGHADPTHPINVDSYRQLHWEEQETVPSLQLSDGYKGSADGFSHHQASGEKLIPVRRSSIISTCIKFIPPALIIFLLIFLFSGGGNLLKGLVLAKIPIVQHVPISLPARVLIRSQRGQVHIHTGSANMVTITTNRATPAWSFGARPGMNVDENVVDNGHTVLINVARTEEHAQQNEQGINLDVAVPPGIDIQAIVQHGSVHIEGVRGTMNIEASGSINAQNVNSASGRITFKSHDGAIDVDQLGGQAFFTTYQGHIEVVNAHLTGLSRMNTQDGKIAFDGNVDPESTYSFGTRTGAVEVSLPSTASFALHIFAGSGAVDNAFESAFVGPVPRAQIEIVSISGNVEINENN